MEFATRAQILDKAVPVTFRTDALGKCMIQSHLFTQQWNNSGED